MAIWAPRAATLPSGGWVVGTNLGVPGGIPADYTKSGSTITSTGDTTDRASDIQAALNAASGGQYVFLGPGVFSYNSTISIPTGVLLRGSGKGVTALYPGNCGIFIGSGSDYQWAWPDPFFAITGGLTKGSTSLTVSSTTDFNVGNLIRLKLGSDYSVPVVDVGGTGLTLMQITRVTAKDSTHLTIYPPCLDDYSNCPTAYVATAQVTKKNSGLEDLTIHAAASSYSFSVWFQQQWGGWMKGVEILDSSNYCVQIEDSLQVEITECVFGNLQSGGSNKAQVLVNTATGFYVYNNIFLDAQPNLESNSGSSGVFSYNAVPESTSGIAVDTNHGPWNQFILVEGSYIPHTLSDSYSGGERYGHKFRNAITAVTNGSPSYSIAGKRWYLDSTAAGNIIGDPEQTWANDGISFGQPNLGNDGSTGTASHRSSSATLSTRTNATSGVLTGQSGHGITTGQTLDYIVWNDGGSPPTARIRRSVTVGTVSGTSIPFSGGAGYDLPSSSSTVYIPTTNDAIRAYRNQLNGSGSTITGTLTTRTSNSVGVITLSGTGTIATGSQATLYWSGGSRRYVVVGTVSGSAVPIDADGVTAGDVLPVTSTAITIWPGVSGFQELDLDVLATAEMKANYYTFTGNIPAVESLGSDTLPDSLYLTEKPAFFGSLDFPPYNSSSPDFDIELIPSGYRYVHGVDPPSGGTIEATSAIFGTLTIG